MIHPCHALAALAFAALAAPLPAAGQEASTTTEAGSGSSDCETRSSSGIIRILLCGEGVDAEELAEAGRAACDGALPCGAWFYTSADKLPAEAPENHDGLPPEQVRTARGVYVAESDLLIEISKVD